MPDSPWRYDVATHRFRDSRSGRFLSATTAVDLRDGFQDRRRVDVDDLVHRLADQDLSVQDFEREMTQLIRQLHTAQFALGRGGLNAMTDDDYAAADALVEAQRVYLRAFAEDVAAGKLSEAQIAARAKLYYGSSIQAYEHGRAAAFGMPRLSHYPADGQDACRSSCRCHLEITETDDEWRVRWQRRSGESCADCRARASSWNPLVIGKTSEQRGLLLFQQWRQRREVLSPDVMLPDHYQRYPSVLTEGR